MNARSSIASSPPLDMQNATRKRLFESLHPPMESLTRIRCQGWNKATSSFPTLQHFWKSAIEGSSFNHFPSGFRTSEAAGLCQNQRKIPWSSSQLSQLRVKPNGEAESSGASSRQHHCQSVSSSFFSRGRSQWRSTPFPRNSSSRFRSKGPFTEYSKPLHISPSLSCESSSNGETKTQPEDDTKCSNGIKPSKEGPASDLQVSPIVEATQENTRVESDHESSTKDETVSNGRSEARNIVEAQESEFSTILDSDSSSEEHSEDGQEFDDVSTLSSSSTKLGSAPTEVHIKESKPVDDVSESTMNILTAALLGDQDTAGDSLAKNVNLASDDESFAHHISIDRKGDDLPDRASSQDMLGSAKSGEENCSSIEKDEKGFQGDPNQNAKADRPKKKRKKFKIVQEDVQTNTLGPFGEIALPPEKLRVDTRDSILRNQELQDDHQGSGSVVQAPPVEDVHINGEVEVVNGSPPPVRNRKHEPVLLLMIGCQGSGKTKFSLDLVQYGAITWARINQDTLRGPSTRGLREECVVKARQLLELGYCIVVDRMNFTDDQRSGFLALAKELGLTAHAVVFKLPFVDNVHNVATRTDHEGGFQGSTRSHKEIIRRTRSRLFYQKGLPKESNEGFDTIVNCENNEHYAAAFRQWVNYGRPMSGGQTLTMEVWRRLINEKSRVMFSRARGHLHRPLQPASPEVKEAAVGYVPGRDGPLLEESSEEEAEESDED